MKILTLLSRKGGSGKSTLAVHWAVEAQRAGIGRVVIVDMDPQGTSAAWYEAREAETPELLTATPATLRKTVQLCENDGVDLVVIDTVPDITRSARVAASVADLVVIPTRPSFADLLAIWGSIELVTELGRTATIVINGHLPSSTLADEARAALEEYELPICPTNITTRAIFTRALTDGRTAGEIEPSSKADQEVQASWKWLARLLGTHLYAVKVA